MAPWARLFWTLYLSVEDRIVHFILRSPSFHRGVRRIHRTVENLRYGRDPNEPLRQGEATAEPSRSQSFLKHFIEELRNQARGKPTDLPPNPPKD
ncbi:4df078db-4c21-4391-9e20-c6c0809050e8 [Thermothielavioides terrestris]|uniref:Uncharacterized protein n=2 Tax=Thermothielavioides terrestris TaxID=2587410 RepID=G2R6N6_THETT|nr:uncharacterized protein THITE_2116540 [Thermothielavioides terrestris NRRL 8126]AEO67668.1 hypothetical protein THITE_2116540 [Thermothielavioides terrestris NRRL 8126]SPQ25798.1 4df078db-4c21-4391-9e20-c6c0809050e8 [Thermothielavioides terrestris]